MSQSFLPVLEPTILRFLHFDLDQNVLFIVVGVVVVHVGKGVFNGGIIWAHAVGLWTFGVSCIFLTPQALFEPKSPGIALWTPLLRTETNHAPLTSLPLPPFRLFQRDLSVTLSPRLLLPLCAIMVRF